MDIANSQKKSPRDSVTSEKTTTSFEVKDPVSRSSLLDEEQYLDRSTDLLTRIRTAKDAARRELEAFGDPSEYTVTLIGGRESGTTQPVQAALDANFRDATEAR